MGDSSASYATNALKSNDGPNISMIDKSNSGTLGVGTYKGVMLCNRPFAGTEASKAAGGGETKSFHVGVVPTEICVNSMPGKDKIRRKRKETALTKHKKWLAELQKKKDNLELQYTMDYISKAEAKEKFNESETNLRRQTKEILKSDGKKSDNKKDMPNLKQLPMKAVENKVERKNKPAWAKTEEDASDSKDIEIDEEDDGLVDFALNLDFEKYMDDVEIKTMIDMVKRRINELERENKIEISRENEADERAKLKDFKDNSIDYKDENLCSNENNNSSENENSMNIAKDILNSTENLKSIHSTQSVAAIYRSAREKDPNDIISDSIKCDLEECIPRKKASASFSYHSGIPQSNLIPIKLRREGSNIKICKECSSKLSNISLQPIGTPLIQSHDVTEGTRIEVKNSIAKLPYMNRNPAI